MYFFYVSIVDEGIVVAPPADTNIHVQPEPTDIIYHI